LFKRVTIDRNRELQVEIRINLLNLINDNPPQNDDPNKRGSNTQRLEGTNQDKIKTVGIHPSKLDLTSNYVTYKRLDGENQNQIKTAGIYPGWRYFI
jgi:hypothetical protein